MSAGRIALVVVGGLLALLAVAALAAGSILLWAHQSKRDDDGYYTSGVLQLATDSYALTAGGIEISDVPDEVFDNGRFAQVRLRGSTTNDKEIFIGIAPQRDVDTYLQDVAHDEVDHVTFTGTDSPEDVEYRRMGGTGAPDPPGDQTFWSASASGPGEQTVDWDVTEGDWAFVTMNADGSEGVAVSMTVGAKAGFVLGAALFALMHRQDEVAMQSATDPSPVPAQSATPAAPPPRTAAKPASPKRAAVSIEELDDAELQERRKRAAEAISRLPMIDRAIWETQSTLLIHMLDDDDPRPAICPLLERYEELAPTRLQLQPPAGSTKPVRFVQCRAY